MLLTPSAILAVLRILAVGCGLALAGLMLGPFQGLERLFGLSDFAAHAVAAFALCLGLFTVAPAWRRLDLALVVLGLGLLMELAQALTGRSLSLADFGADCLGVAAAVLPGKIEAFRQAVRTTPYADVFDLLRRDPRRARRAAVLRSSPTRRPVA
jgi:hypothetical protein